MEIKKIMLQILIGIFLVAPLIYSFTFFNGFAGQIKPTDYPSDWYDVNKFLDGDKQDFKVLFFPWHGYMDFGWVNNTDKRIANPAKYFFNKEVISGTTVEVGGIYRQDNDSEQLYVDNLLKNRSKITNFGKLVSVLNAKYIILTKEVDYKEYFFLFNQTDLELVKDTENLYVFRNKNDVSEIYQTDDINNIESEKISVDYQKISPVKYDIKGNISKKYIVFTEPYSEDWKLDGKNPMKAYGTVNAYIGSGNAIIFERFYRINLPSYVISLITSVVLIIYYIKK
jgi:hypothetical protein